MYGSGWEDSDTNMRLGGDGQVISDLNSQALGSRLTANEAVFAGDGWETHSYATFTETNIKVNDDLRLLISARLDKGDYSKWLLSPRFSTYYEINDKSSLRLIAQKSHRRNTASHEFIEHQQGLSATTESLNSIEAIYTRGFGYNYTMTTGIFYNDAESIAWDSNNDLTVWIGDLKTMGLELELNQQSETSQWGVNYAYTKQLNFQLAPNVQSSGISYADYRQPIGSNGAIIESTGNDLNNWANHSTKLFYNRYLTQKWHFHVNTQLFWDYQGSKDGLTALENAVQGTPDETATEAAIQNVKEADAFGLNFKTNLAIGYDYTEKSQFKLNFFNIFGKKHSKRYSYSTGTSKVEPHKTRFTHEEPAIGLQFNHKW